jgi:hypothetical protein
MMADNVKQDALKPVLQEAEDELSRRLHEACVAESTGLASKTSDEIREIEDSLLAAAVAAGQAISLRRHMQERDEKDNARDAKIDKPRAEAMKLEQAAAAKQSAEARQAAQGHEPPAAPAPFDRDPIGASTVREFRDSSGQQWRAWPVIPGMSRTGKPRQYLGEFQRGWICFESLDSPARRRLPCAPARLAETKDEELERLLLEAITAPERKGAPKPH